MHPKAQGIGNGGVNIHAAGGMRKKAGVPALRVSNLVISVDNAAKYPA